MVLPEYIFVSGMPFFLRGYNGKYCLTKDEDKKIYTRVDNVPYYGHIEINDSFIVRNNNTDVWSFHHTPCKLPFLKLTKDNSSPTGEWSEGIVVAPEKSWMNLWENNRGIIKFITLIAVMAASIYHETVLDIINFIMHKA